VAPGTAPGTGPGTAPDFTSGARRTIYAAVVLVVAIAGLTLVWHWSALQEERSTRAYTEATRLATVARTMGATVAHLRAVADSQREHAAATLDSVRMAAAAVSVRYVLRHDTLTLRDPGPAVTGSQEPPAGLMLVLPEPVAAFIRLAPRAIDSLTTQLDTLRVGLRVSMAHADTLQAESDSLRAVHPSTARSFATGALAGVLAVLAILRVAGHR
jgi:hypothetical protein